MDKSSVDWHGPMPALVTPFDAEGAIDEAAFQRNVELCIGYGMTGLLVGGCTGEFWALTLEERKRITKLCVDAAKGRVPVISGTGAVRTEHVIELSQYAKDVGCDGAMVLPPYFVKPSTEDIIAHYETVSDAVDIPILLYNIPANAVNDLTPELVDRLADVKNVVAIKESGGNFNAYYKTMTLCSDRIHVFVGPSTLYGVAAILLGAPGYIDTIPNLWGEEAVELYEVAAKADLPRARQLQEKALALRELVNGNGRNMYCSVKAGMNMLGLPGGHLRNPLRSLKEPHLSQIRDGLVALGFKPAQAAAE